MGAARTFDSGERIDPSGQLLDGTRLDGPVGLRKVLVDRQRHWVDQHGGGVVEGRDIGTVVFPDAALKVYLTASDDERAHRRQRDERAADRNVDVESVRDALDRRDRLDSTRATSPLRRADDALVIDTTTRDAADVVAEIVARYNMERAR